MVNFNFVIVLILILIGMKLLVNNEHFTSNCSQYGNNYNPCYNSGHCTIMIDTNGNAFCTDKII